MTLNSNIQYSCLANRFEWKVKIDDLNQDWQSTNVHLKVIQHHSYIGIYIFTHLRTAFGSIVEKNIAVVEMKKSIKWKQLQSKCRRLVIVHYNSLQYEWTFFPRRDKKTEKKMYLCLKRTEKEFHILYNEEFVSCELEKKFRKTYANHWIH